MSEQHIKRRGLAVLAALAITSLLVACGAGGDDENGAPAATATGTPAATVVASTKFVQSEDQGGAGIWQRGEAAPGLAIGALCGDLGGTSRLGVNGGARTSPASVGSRYVGVTREGTWAVWLSAASAEALPKVPAGEVANQTLVARIDQGLMLAPGDPYLACN